MRNGVKRIISITILTVFLFMMPSASFASAQSALFDACGSSLSEPVRTTSDPAAMMVEYALSQVGNSGEYYSTDRNWLRNEWCAWFVVYCADHVDLAGTAGDITGNLFPPIDRNTWQTTVPNWAATHQGYMAKWMSSNGKGTLFYLASRTDSVIGYNQNTIHVSRDEFIPMPGDLIFFDWELDGYWNHIAIVVSYNESDDTVTYVGGNQSVEGSDSYLNREVTVVTRERAEDVIAAYLRPDYTPKYSVIYDGNGGTEEPSPQIKTAGTDLILSESIPFREDYIFRGWALSEDSTVPVYMPGDIYTDDCDVVLYAVWERAEVIKPITDPTIVLSDGNGFYGEDLTVNISLVNNPGVFSLSLTPEYDSAVLTLTEILPGSIGGSIETGADGTVCWYSGSGNDVTSDGILAVLHFHVSSGITLGDTSVTISYGAGDIYNTAGESVLLGVMPATISLSDKPSHIPGDINGDGSVNNKDLLWLMKWIKGKPVMVVEEALDVNGDENRNNKDLLWLMKYLKGKDVIIY